MTVVRAFFKTNVTVSAVTVSVVKTNVFSTLEGTWVRIYAYLHYMTGPGLNFGGPKTDRAWKIWRKNGLGRDFLACSGVYQGSTGQTVPLIDQMCFKFINVSYFVVCYF